jgi:hypothetical protein
MRGALKHLALAARTGKGSAPTALFPPLRPLWGRLQRSHGYHIRPVYDEKQRGLVSALVQRRYAWRGYNTEALDYPIADANRLTLAAWQYGELAATLTLGRDSLQGLDADALYAAELARLRRPQRVLCEVSRLAVDPDFGSSELLVSLFSAAFDYGRRLFAASDVVIGVNPRHAGYYQRRLGFRRIGAQQHCACVDAPVVLLHQALDCCERWQPVEPGKPQRYAGNAA